MIERLQVYKCNVCGIVADVLEEGAGELVCCGEPMVLQKEKTQDSASEKHVPYIEKTDAGVKVRIGQNDPHPMIEKHYIQWIELLVDGKSYRQFLKPGDEPAAVFSLTGENLSAREMCNIHGLWKGE